jgi:CRP-like cAMP-binding protein
MADIALRDAPTRIAHFLLEISVRLCLAGLPARPSYPCPLIQQDLADALGMTSIHVNRMLREARALGLYEFRRGEVVFLDYAATVAFAEFDRDFLSRPETARSRARGVYAGAT